MDACAPTPSLRSRTLDSLAGLGFLLVLAAPTLDFAVRPDDRVRSPQEVELRTPASKPPLPATLQELVAFPPRYEAYFKDSFGLRDKLLRWNSAVKVFGFGVSPSPEVFLGKDLWMFYTGERSLENHRGALPFGQAGLVEWAAVLEKKRALLEQIGSKYLYVVVPDKESVYRDHLPAYMRQVGPTRLEQWLAYLREHAPRVEILDLHEAFFAARATHGPAEPLYMRLGTHWSGLGAQVALTALVQRLESLAGGFAPEELDAFQRVEFHGSGDSWATRMYIDDLVSQKCDGFVPPSRRAKLITEGEFKLGRVRKTECPESTRPRVILMHDSFGPQIEDGLSEQCSYLECRWMRAADMLEIEASRPDVVIDMFVERSLNHRSAETLVPADPRPWEKRFQLSQTTLLDVDRGSPTWGFTTEGEAVIGTAALTPNPRLPVTVDRPRDALWIGPFTPVPGEIPVLHVVIDAPEATDLLLLYRPPDRNDVVRRHLYRVPLVGGRNEFFAPLDKPGTSGKLLLRPGERPGSYLLRAFEVRSVRGS